EQERPPLGRMAADQGSPRTAPVPGRVDDRLREQVLNLGLWRVGGSGGGPHPALQGPALPSRDERFAAAGRSPHSVRSIPADGGLLRLDGSAEPLFALRPLPTPARQGNACNE